MEFDEDDSGDIGKLSSWLHDERLLHRYWFAKKLAKNKYNEFCQ